MEREGKMDVDQKAERLASAEKFLHLLYNYDTVGENAYFKKFPNSECYNGVPVQCERDYRASQGKKYIRITAPYADFAVDSEGWIFKRRGSKVMKDSCIGNISSFLDENSWGENIYRVHSRALRGTGPSSSGIFDYHDLQLRHHIPNDNAASGVQENRSSNVVMVSDMVKEMMPLWKGFIIDLGYKEEQAEAFAQGYAERLARLPILGKLIALDEQEPQCMTAGFKAAGIDENEALARYQKSSE